MADDQPPAGEPHPPASPLVESSPPVERPSIETLDGTITKGDDSPRETRTIEYDS